MLSTVLCPTPPFSASLSSFFSLSPSLFLYFDEGRFHLPAAAAAAEMATIFLLLLLVPAFSKVDFDGDAPSGRFLNGEIQFFNQRMEKRNV